jgi:putative ABC transport system substrate-binding protein
MVGRRVVLMIGALRSSMAVALEGRAQPSRKFSIGWLAPGAPLAGGVYDQFLERAKQLGYSEGTNLAVVYRHFDTADAGKVAAEELVRLKPDLIVAQAPASLLAARHATRTVPIVTFYIGDPIRMGVTRSLARPDGNVTGFTWDMGIEGTAKALEVVKEIVPDARRVAVLWNLENDSHPFYVEEFQAHARKLRLAMLSMGVRSADEFERAFRRMAAQEAQAVIVFADPFTIRNRDVLTATLARFAIPVMWGSAQWPLPGSVVTLSTNVDDQPRGVAEYVDRILRGASPSSLPFQQPTRVDLIVDAKVARSLGLKLPRSLLSRADRVVDE